MTESERNELIRFIESITFNAPKDGKPSWIKPAFDMIKEVIINKIDDIYNENEMREIELHRKSYKELQKTVVDLSLENCLMKNKIELMKWIPCSKKLPDYDELVLATDDCYRVFVAWYSVIHGWCSDRYGCCYVAAWMPLPKAYEGEKDE